MRKMFLMKKGKLKRLGRKLKPRLNPEQWTRILENMRHSELKTRVHASCNKIPGNQTGRKQYATLAQRRQITENVITQFILESNLSKAGKKALMTAAREAIRFWIHPLNAGMKILDIKEKLGIARNAIANSSMAGKQAKIKFIQQRLEELSRKSNEQIVFLTESEVSVIRTAQTLFRERLQKRLGNQADFLIEKVKEIHGIIVVHTEQWPE